MKRNQRHGGRDRRRKVAAAAVVVGAMIGTASTADGYLNNYCGQLVSANVWCQSNADHKYDTAGGDINQGPGGMCVREVGVPGGGIRGSGAHCSGYYDINMNWCYASPGQTAGDYYAAVKGTPVSGNAVYDNGRAWYGVGGDTFSC